MSKIGRGYQVGISWLPLHGGRAPSEAIEVADGIYVARARYGREILPGKYVRRYRTFYVCYGGEEHELSDGEILCNTSINGEKCYVWREDSRGRVPKHAIVAGIAADGAPLHICQAKIGGEKCVGKIHIGHDCGYVPYGGKEHVVDDYKVLCLRKD